MPFDVASFVRRCYNGCTLINTRESTMNNTQTLAVIDMQDYFGNAQHCLDGVLDEVKHAIKNNMPVMVVEYWDRCYRDSARPRRLSKTNKPIRDLLHGYKHKAYVKKYNDGGGYEIEKVAKKRNFTIENIRLVGVNRSYCVYQTADQIMDINMSNNNGKKGRVEVVKGASWCSYPEGGLDSLKRIGCILVSKHRKVVDPTS